MVYIPRASQAFPFLGFLMTVASQPATRAPAAGIGPCHPYPGADAKDCLNLIRDNLNNDEEQKTCNDGLATITFGACAISTTCKSGETVGTDLAARRGLTIIGSCALSDYGSTSGYYIGDDGDKTCVLYPGGERSCA